MFLVLIVILTVGQLYLEFKIVHALHLEEFQKKFIFVNLGLSLGLSVVLSKVFPAAGMTVMSAGLISTVLSQPMYKVYLGSQKYVAPNVAKAKSGYATNQVQINQTLKDLGRFIMIIILIITFPFRVLRTTIRIYDNMKEKSHA